MDGNWGMARVSDGLEEEDYECLAWLAVLCWPGRFGAGVGGGRTEEHELHSTVQRTQQKVVIYFFFTRVFI